MKRSIIILFTCASLFLMSNFQSSEKRLNVSLKNSTKLELSDIRVDLVGTVISFPSLAPNAQTKWMKVKSAYTYAYIKFRDSKKREYVLQPKEYTREHLMNAGNLTYIIKSVDTISGKIELDHSLKLK